MQCCARKINCILLKLIRLYASVLLSSKNTYAFNAVSWVDNVLWDNYILWDVDHETFGSEDHQYWTASSTTTIIRATSQCTTPKMVSDWHQHFELYTLVHITFIFIVLRNALLIASALFRHSNRLSLVESWFNLMRCFSVALNFCAQKSILISQLLVLWIMMCFQINETSIWESHALYFVRPSQFRNT